MFERILYPTDFSEVAKKALKYIRRISACGTNTVIVLHVIDLRALGGRVDTKTMEKTMEDNVAKEMKKIEAELKGGGFEVKLRIEKGVPIREILRVEKEENASMVVVGSHGMSLVEEVLLGSVSENIIRHSERPVLVVRR